MEPKYRITSTLTKEQYEDYIQVLQQKMFVYNWFTYMLSAVVMLVILLVVRNDDGSINSKWMIVPAIVAMIGLAQYVREKNAMKMWDSQPAMHNLVSTYSFYDDHITQENERATWDVSYSDIKKVLETPISYILMLQSSQGFILEKQNCPEGWMEFVVEHMRNKK